ncbi:MAG: hypothetical protein JOY63_01790 [Acetobacteraceae bacterium]|nr:hypothetical protein [Acetobacteraceae bacterium]
MTKQDQVFFTRLCDMMRDARLSTRYYEDRLWWANAVNFGFEIVIAIGATGSGIAGWALWQSGSGVWIWGFISGASALLAIVKPIVTPGRLIEIRSRQYNGWHLFFFSVERLLLAVRCKGAFSEQDRRAFERLLSREASLSLEDEKCLNRRVLRRLKPLVEDEIPVESLLPCGDAPAVAGSPDEPARRQRTQAPMPRNSRRGEVELDVVRSAPGA